MTAAVLLLPFVAALGCFALAVLSVVRNTRTWAAWCFFTGMILLAVDSVFTARVLLAAAPGDVAAWVSGSLAVKSFLPVVWLAFSLAYSRGEQREFLRRWRITLIALAMLPIAALLLQGRLVTPVNVDSRWVLELTGPGKALHALLIVGFVLTLMNLEQTFRSAVGTMRWRIKFVVIAFAIIFGTALYVRSQAILFSAYDLALALVESGAVLLGCLCLGLAYARTGLAEIDVYPSRAVLRSSLTIVIVGAYLFAVGVLAQLVTRFGGTEIFQFQAFVVLIGIAGLAVLLLSNRARQQLDAFTSRHFRQAQHDSVRVWAMFSRGLANVNDQRGLSAIAARLVSETFDALSVTVWLHDEDRRQFVAGASTTGKTTGEDPVAPDAVSSDVVSAVAARSRPFDLDQVSDGWAQDFRALNPATFTEGGPRICVPLHAGEHVLGAIVLADRVSATPYTAEDLELLKCIGDQIASVLTNLRLAGEVARGRELDAFRTMSTFFVHDLKNAATSLNLMLKNFPLHYDDPAFREDALRGIGQTVRRIEDTIARLTELRQRPELTPVEADLNQLVQDALARVVPAPDIEVSRELHPVPRVLADPDQLQSVVANLVQNARDAVGAGGHIRVRTEYRNRRVVLSIADNGCGMSQAFVQESLFRPFQTTKKQGLGIGLFQSHAIVRAHGGGMDVKTEVGKGTTFLVSLPARGDQ